MKQTGTAVRGKPPLILDFDASVPPLGAGEIRLSLETWQEAIRFGCSWRDFFRLENYLRRELPREYGCVFTGSGDFHHLSLFLLREISRRSAVHGMFDLIVLDQHPDNMRYPFGLHCGSWISHAAALPGIRHVHVLGICSADITLPHAWENRLAPFFRRRLTYWSIARRAAWLRLIGRGNCCRTFSSADALVEAFLPVIIASPRIYFSLDKDVLSPEIVRTNWDQGLFSGEHLEALAVACRGKLSGADICGDVSDYAYASRFKRFLSRLDGQQPLGPEETLWGREKHQAVNIRLLELLGLG
jgi:hypothetical protein